MELALAPGPLVQYRCHGNNYGNVEMLTLLTLRPGRKSNNTHHKKWKNGKTRSPFFSKVLYLIVLTLFWWKLSVIVSVFLVLVRSSPQFSTRAQVQLLGSIYRLSVYSLLFLSIFKPYLNCFSFITLSLAVNRAEIPVKLCGWGFILDKNIKVHKLNWYIFCDGASSNSPNCGS